MDPLRYPIGHFQAPENIDENHIQAWIAEIEALPGDLRRVVEPLSESQLDTPYRPGGWTIRQVVHHLPDSHMNSFIRFKWALTEDSPQIKGYFEDRWAKLPDYSSVPISVSLDLLESLHQRWVVLLRSLGPEDLSREFIHPESGSTSLVESIGAYGWHGRHHLAHIEETVSREGWGSGFV
ncbi:MAG: putative metal-dependent hydrolase [Acidobacteria bacterium]|nr:putative metal-dependent hydrolase [Acidobacteriota bacterium]